jgi:competence protein ComEA
LRFKPAIVFIAALLVTVSLVSYLSRWMDERAGPEKPIYGVVVRGPGGAVEILPRRTTVGEALGTWDVDKAGLDKETLERRLFDGSWVRIEEVDGERKVTMEKMMPAERIAAGLTFDINEATTAELDLIPNVGEATARTIVAYRKAHGPFESAVDLEKVPALGAKKAREIAAYVTFGEEPEKDAGPMDAASLGARREDEKAPAGDKLTKPDRPIDINRATMAELMRIPGVGEVTAQRIIDYRTTNGPLRSIADLEKVDGIGEKKAKKIGGYTDLR